MINYRYSCTALWPLFSAELFALLSSKCMELREPVIFGTLGNYLLSVIMNNSQYPKNGKLCPCDGKLVPPLPAKVNMGITLEWKKWPSFYGS
jgi:hypothetical protein